MCKVNLQVTRPRVTKKVVELLGLDDERVVEYAMGLLGDGSQIIKIRHPFCLTLSFNLIEQTPDPNRSADFLGGHSTSFRGREGGIAPCQGR